MMPRFHAGLGVAALLAGACARSTPTPAITITATDYAFAAPETIPAGVVTLRLVNRGRELHHAVLVRLEAGKTAADFQAAAQAIMQQHAAPPEWISFAGGPNTVDPVDTAEVTETLEPGVYVLFCVIPGPDGIPHVAKGMFRTLVVAGGAASRAEPATTNVLTLSDYDFRFQTPLTAGTHVIRVDNSGPQVHEVVLAELRPGKSIQDFLAWEAGGEKGPPPVGRWQGGVAALDSVRHAVWTLTVRPGRYLLLCFWPDAADGKPHLVHGMVKEIAVS